MEKIYTPAAALGAIALVGGLLLIAEHGPENAGIALVGTAVSLGVLAAVLALLARRRGSPIRDDSRITAPAGPAGSRVITGVELMELDAVNRLGLAPRPRAELNI